MELFRLDKRTVELPPIPVGSSDDESVSASEVRETLEWLRSELDAAADPKFREGQTWFFKEPVDSYGVRTVHLNRIVRDLYRRVKSWKATDRNRLCTEMWKHGRLEESAAVCHLYRRFAPECHECEFRLFEQWLDRYVHTWAHCDGLSTWLFAASLQNEPKLIGELAGWTRSPNRWRRRSAAVALLQEAKAGRNLEAILDISDRLAGDRDDMVEKGVGWLLKEAYPKRPAAVFGFLRKNRERFSRTTLRYAAEKMTVTHRKSLLFS